MTVYFTRRRRHSDEKLDCHYNGKRRFKRNFSLRSAAESDRQRGTDGIIPVSCGFQSVFMSTFFASSTLILSDRLGV